MKYSPVLLNLSKIQMQEAIEKAESAYGDTVRRDLKKAIQHLSECKGRLDDCMSALKINEIPKALLWSKIRMLGKI